MVVCCGLLKSAFVTVLIKRCLKKIRRKDFCLVPRFVILPEWCVFTLWKIYAVVKDKGDLQVSALTAAILGRQF